MRLGIRALTFVSEVGEYRPDFLVGPLTHRALSLPQPQRGEQVDPPAR